MGRSRIISGSQPAVGKGMIRAVIEAQGAALKLIESAEGKSGANDVIREAMQAGGDFWVSVFLPQRFTEKAKQLGYTGSAGWAARKQKLTGQAIPLVFTGAMRDNAIAAAYASATAKKGGGTIRIRIPIDHGGVAGRSKGGQSKNSGLQPKDQAVLRRIPEYEIKRIAAEIEKRLIDVLSLRGAGTMTKAPVANRRTLGAIQSREGAYQGKRAS